MPGAAELSLFAAAFVAAFAFTEDAIRGAQSVWRRLARARRWRADEPPE